MICCCMAFKLVNVKMSLDETVEGLKREVHEMAKQTSMLQNEKEGQRLELEEAQQEIVSLRRTASTLESQRNEVVFSFAEIFTGFSPVFQRRVAFAASRKDVLAGTVAGASRQSKESPDCRKGRTESESCRKRVDHPASKQPNPKPRFSTGKDLGKTNDTD